VDSQVPVFPSYRLLCPKQGIALSLSQSNLVGQVMKILVTAGTTPFDSLFAHLDKLTAKFPHMAFIGQVGHGDYTPQTFPSFNFTPEFTQQIASADAVITHAGAGTVYDLLEQGKRCIVIANLERKDKHQLEITRYVSDSGYALATTDLADLEELLKRLETFEPAGYEKTDFFLADEIYQKLVGSLR
jgi:beta-1,4-N-acetylglucosaminyltransferase